MKAFLLYFSVFIVSHTLLAQPSIAKPTIKSDLSELALYAKCNIERFDIHKEIRTQTSVSKPLLYHPVGTEVDSATAFMTSSLIPSYKIIFAAEANGRAEKLILKVVRASNGEILSSFESSALFLNYGNESTKNSIYVAHPKLIFLSDDDNYQFDITCYILNNSTDHMTQLTLQN